MFPAKPWWSPCSPKPQHRQDTRHRRCRALSLCFAGVRPGVSGWFNCSRCSTDGLASGKAKDIAPLVVRTFGTGKAVGDIKYCREIGREIQHLAGHAGYTAGFACSWLTESGATVLEGVPFDSVLAALQPACVCLYQAACPAEGRRLATPGPSRMRIHRSYDIKHEKEAECMVQNCCTIRLRGSTAANKRLPPNPPPSRSVVCLFRNTKFSGQYLDQLQ
jgi:hypothetical protein